MNAPKAWPEEDRHIEQLARFDESLVRGNTATDQSCTSLLANGESGARRRLEREIECIRLLERVWPRSGERREGANEEARMPNDEVSVMHHSSFGHSSFAARFGRFEIRRPLGYGAHGLVFLAYDPTLRREVALKIPRPEVLIRNELRLRFVREARASAALDHPNIVPVFEAGQAGAACYIATAYCRGPTLADRLKEQSEPFSAPDAALLVALLADGVAHAHQRGVLHRDLKPSNILLDRPSSPAEADEGEAVANLGFIPRISDFGLAKFNDIEQDRTKSGMLLGTIGYMAPEQAAPGSRRGDPVSEASDVYSLGVILYELITGRPPFQGESPLEVLQQVQEAEAVPPRRLRGRIPRDLETICLKCLEKNPRDRYETAAALAADMRRFLRGAPINARPVPASGRLLRWCCRNPALAAASGLAALGLFLFAVVSASFAVHQSRARANLAAAARQLEAEKQQTLAALERAENEFASAQRQSAISALDQGLRLCERGDEARGMLWLARSLKIAASLDHPDAGDLERMIRANLGAWRSELKPLVGVFEHGAEIDGLALSRDGTKLLTDGTDGNVKLWDVESGQQLGRPMVHVANVIPVEISPCGRFVLTGSSDHQARLWDAATGKVIANPLMHPGEVRVAVFHEDGRRIVTGTSDGARLWDTATARLVGEPMIHPAGSVTAARFIPNSQLVVTGSWDHKVRVWDTTSSSLVSELPHEGPVYCLAASLDGRLLLSGSADGEARVWDARSGAPIGDPLRHPDEVLAAAFQDGEQHVVTVCRDRKLRLWNIVTGTETATSLPIPTSDFAVVITPDARMLVTAGQDGLARLWDLSCVGYQVPGVGGSTASKFVLQHPDEVRAIACSPDGRFVATGCMDHAARLWDLATGGQVGPSLVHGARVLAVAFSHDGNTVATSSADNTARLWDRRGEARALPHRDKVNDVAFSPVDHTMVTACEDGIVRFWNSHDGSLRPSLELRHRSAVQSAAFTADGRKIITSAASGAVRVWDARTAELRGTIYHLGKVRDVAASPNCRTLLTAGTDLTGRMWDLATRQPIGRPLAHDGSVRSATFSPDGLLAVTGSEDGTARLWDVATGRPVGPPFVHEGPVSAAMFDPEGRTVLTGSLDKTVRRWPVAPPVEGKPALVERWVEALTGMELDDIGVMHPLDGDDWNARRIQAPEK